MRWLESLCLCNEEFQFLCKGQELRGLFDRVSRLNPEADYVFLGSNDML